MSLHKNLFVESGGEAATCVWATFTRHVRLQSPNDMWKPMCETLVFILVSELQHFTGDEDQGEDTEPSLSSSLTSADVLSLRH